MESVLQDAAKHRKEGRIHQALEVYDQLYHSGSSTFSSWDYWNYIYCLQHAKKYQLALEICRIAYTFNKSFEPIQHAYAWTIYYSVFSKNGTKLSESESRKAVDAVWKLYPPNVSGSPAYRCSFARIKQLAEEMTPNWTLIWSELKRMDEKVLSHTPYSIQIPGRKKSEMASDLEEWYSWCSKAFLHLEMWNECISICQRALQNLKEWHYSNEIWFKRRMSAAFYKIGQAERARELIDEILLVKNDWFIMADRAFYSEDKIQALQWYARASLSRGDYSMKISMWEKMVKILLADGQYDLAKLHVKLIAAIRSQMGWSNKLIEGVSVEDQDLGTPQENIQQLSAVWESMLPNKWKPQMGVIKQILKDNFAGFIEHADKKESIYFRVRQLQFRNNTTSLIGKKVQFWLKETIHPKTGKKAWEAVQIKLV